MSAKPTRRALDDHRLRSRSLWRARELGSEVEQICSRVLIISSGKLLADDSLSNLLSDGQSLEDAYMRIAASEKVV